MAVGHCFCNCFSCGLHTDETMAGELCRTDSFVVVALYGHFPLHGADDSPLHHLAYLAGSEGESGRGGKERVIVYCQFSHCAGR